MFLDLLIAVGLGFTSPPSAAVQADFANPPSAVRIYPEAVEIIRESALPLSQDTAVALAEEFESVGTYYGAFAVGKGGEYGYVIGANSMEAAREIALLECERHTNACLIYSELRPIGYTPLTFGEVSMSFEAAEIYEGFGDRAPARAMAISEDGAYSLVWAHQNSAEAEAAAIADCNNYIIDDLPGLRSMACVALPIK